MTENVIKRENVWLNNDLNVWVNNDLMTHWLSSSEIALKLRISFNFNQNTFTDKIKFHLNQFKFSSIFD